MKLIKFVGVNLHGYLNLSVQFNDNLTFLTGINGSGKTSVVRGISSLISPSLLALAHTVHDRMELSIQNEDKILSIWSKRDTDHLYLGSSQPHEELKINLFPEEEFMRPDTKSRVIQYYQELETRFADHAILQLIRSLPTPMILGIDRRSTELFENERMAQRLHRPIRRRDNIFRTSLSASLD